MRRISITKLFAMLPVSDRMSTFGLSRSSATPFTKLNAIYVRVETTSHLSIELCTGKDRDVLCIDITAGEGTEFGHADALEIRQLVSDIQREWNLPVLARPMVYLLLDHLIEIGPDRFASTEQLHNVLMQKKERSSSSWWNV